MYEQSFETVFIADDAEQVFDTDFTTSDELFDTDFISEDEVFNTSFESEEPTFDTSFESEEPTFNTEFESIASDNVDLSDYAKKDEIPTKVSQLVNDAGYLTTNEIPGECEALTNIEIENLLKNFI